MKELTIEEYIKLLDEITCYKTCTMIVTSLLAMIIGALLVVFCYFLFKRNHGYRFDD